MRALRFDGQAVVLDKSAAEPVAAAGEAVVIPVVMAGSAADWPLGGEAGRVLGHEFVGVVERVEQPGAEPGFKHALVGQRVVASVSVSCGACELCRKGLGPHCRGRKMLGLPGAGGRDGCFADRVVVPTRNLHVVPAGLSDEVAVFAEPVASALHAKACFRPEGRPYITVLGESAMGLLVVQVMARLNASVRLVGTDPARLSLCDRWGVKQRALAEVGLRGDQDVVIECTGTARGLSTALGMVRPRGRIILKQAFTGGEAGESVPENVDLSPAIASEVEIIGSRCGNIADALAALARGEVDISPLVARRGRLAEGAALLAGVRGGYQSVLLAA